MTTDITRQDEPAPLVQLRKQLEQRAEEFRMVLPEHISPAKFQRTLLTAVQLNPDLLACDRRSFLTACMKSAQDGLLPDGREAAIVVFKTRVKDPERGWVEVRLAQYLPMVFGLRKKILQSAEVSDLFAAVVYRQEIVGGCFHYEEGSERTLRHRPIIDPDFAPTDADIALVYSVATFADGTKSFEVMRRIELDRVREASQTGAKFDAKGNPREAKGPWVQWFPEMAKKTVIRRHSKSLPQSGDVIVRDVESEDMGLAAAKATVAEAARNIACSGAVPLGITDCLNFGNPEKPEVFFQFREACRGIAEACVAFGTPVTGWRLQDGRASWGFGVQVFFLGYPMHFDWTKYTDFATTSQGWDFSFWIGYDF